MATSATSQPAHSGPQDNAQFENSDCSIAVFSSFDDMGLPDRLLRGIYSYGWEKPSAIQQRAIVPVIKGGDVLAQAQSGTGKTGAFSIGALSRVDFDSPTIQIMILSPTRELALQTRDVVTRVSEYAAPKGFLSFCVGGYIPVRENISHIQQNKPSVIVGTPGRVLDLVQKGILQCSHLKCLILDEADDLLNQGFAEQIHSIFKYAPREVQLCLFSATMPTDVLELSEKFMRDPTSILVKKETLTLAGIHQFYIAVEEEYKLETLYDLYDTVSIASSMIFVNSKRKADWLAEQMNKNDFAVSIMHAGLTSEERNTVMEGFRSGRTRVLISTDVLARGIDVHHVSIVINYELPYEDKAMYLHRVGRCGRYGKKGISINMINASQARTQHDLENYYQMSISELPMDFANYLD